MSGALQEIIGIIVFIVVGAAIYSDAKRKVSYSVLVLFGIILFSFFGFFTIYEWKFVGF
jgi:L-cystine uptake protein TcyP (sodium:dicarboxylate symporter family)